MRFPLFLPLVTTLLAGPAHAHDWKRFVEGERAPLLRVDAQHAHAGRWQPRPPGVPAALDVVHRKMDVDVDPRTGVVDASIEVQIRAVGSSLTQLAFGFQVGLSPSSATVNGVAATLSAGVEGSFAYVYVDFPASVAAGTEALVVLHYAGTIACAAADPCSMSSAFSHFTIASIFPYIFDDNSGLAFDGATTELTLRTPPGLDVVVSAEQGESRSEGDRNVTTWTVPRPVAHGYGFYAFVGDLGRANVEGRAVPTTVIGEGPGTQAKIVAWSKEALDFVEESSLVLPFEQQWLVRLPKRLNDPGTVSYGMTLLNDIYADYGDVLYRETWVHENAHLAWAIAVPELEGNRTRLFTEGLATMTEVEFTARHFDAEPRDEYLARRYHNIRLNWLGAGTLEGLPPVYTSEREAASVTTGNYLRYAGWAYEKSSAALDHLRAVTGDAAFLRAQKKYATQYQFAGATLVQFRELLEQESGVALGSTFERWIEKTGRPQVRVGFTKTPTGTLILLEKDDEPAIPLQLWVTAEDGTRTVLPVVASGTSTSLPAPDGIAVFSVRPNPRQGILAQLRSTTVGDIDFDGQTDGLDLLACATHFGETFERFENGPGLWLTDTHFPVECDRNDDGTIDAADWDELEAGFASEGVAP